MISVQIKEYGVTITGYFGYTPEGHDIVYAAMSALFCFPLSLGTLRAGNPGDVQMTEQKGYAWLEVEADMNPTR